jgi:hypothetical protein
MLGGGSNLILTRDPQAVVLKVEVRGLRLVADAPTPGSSRPAPASLARPRRLDAGQGCRGWRTWR